MELSESTSKVNPLDRFLKNYAQLKEVQNNKLELANFVKRVLKFCQFWIDGEISYWRWSLGFFMYFLCNGAMFMALGHLVRHATKSDEFQLSDVTSDIAFILDIPLCYHFFRAFYIPQKQWAALLLELGNFEEHEKPESIELTDAIETAKLKLSLGIFYMPIPLFIYYIFTTECTNSEDTVCGFVFPFYFPGCMGQLRPVCAIIHLGFAYIFATVLHIVARFYSQISEYIVTYLMHFQTMLRMIPLIDDWDERWVHVQKTIKYHQRILELYRSYFKLVKDVSLAHLFGAPIILALLIDNMMIDFRVQDLVHSLVWIFSLIFVCYVGQKMVDESEAVTLEAYLSIPFDGDIKTAKAMLFLLYRTQSTLHIPVGSLTYCGYDLCVSVMKTMYSYLTLINSRRSIEAE